jgi:beta-lactamase regulating signal transducer with metallopeptidase domain
MTLIEMSFSSIVIIIMIILIRTLFLYKLPKRLFVFLWSIVLYRLLLPFSFHFSTPSFLNNVYLYLRSGISTDRPIGAAAADFPELSGKSIGSALPVGTVPAVDWIFLIWCIGIAVTALVFLIPHIRYVMVNRSATPVKNDKVLEWIGEYHFKRRVQVKQAQGLVTPATYGVIRPVILLPKSLKESEEGQLKLIIVHELTHIKHFDVLWKWLLFIAVSIHWFNPFVWIAYALANRDIELSCDETVIRTLNKEISKTSYAMALISLEEHKLKLEPIVSGFNKNAIEERILAIMKIKKLTFTRLVLAFVITFGTLTVFAVTSAKADAPAENKTQSKEIKLIIPDYPVNEQGQTYGHAPYNPSVIVQDPDLMAAIGINGVEGYVKATDLNGPSFSSPQEAIAYQEANRDGRSIPLYESDGTTVIGEFVIGNGSTSLD